MTPATRSRLRRPTGSDAARRAPRWTIYLPLGVYLLFTLVPFYWILLFAFRKTGSTALVPWPLTFEHFNTVWNGAGFGVFFKNSVIIAVLTVLLTTVIALAGGYGLARFSFKGKSACMVLMLCTQFVPGAMMLIPLFDIFRTTHLINTLWSIVVADAVFHLPLSIILMAGFIRNIPIEPRRGFVGRRLRPVPRFPDDRAAAAPSRCGGDQLVRVHLVVEQLPVRADVSQLPGPVHDPGRPELHAR